LPEKKRRYKKGYEYAYVSISRGHENNERFFFGKNSQWGSMRIELSDPPWISKKSVINQMMDTACAPSRILRFPEDLSRYHPADIT